MHSFGWRATIRIRHQGTKPGSWHFVTLSEPVSRQIALIAMTHPRKGWGSVKVEAVIGFVKRKTSIFPESKSGCYILPLKKEIRTQLQIEEGDEVWVEVNLLV